MCAVLLLHMCSMPFYCRKEKKKIAVVLTDDVKGLGVKGEDMPVSKGYARNFLFPKKLAVYKTEENLKLYEADRAVLLLSLPSLFSFPLFLR